MRLVTNYIKKRIVKKKKKKKKKTNTWRQNNMLLSNRDITKEIKEETKNT